MIVNDKRKDIILFIVSVIFLSAEIAEIANILFEEFYSSNKLKMIITVTVLLLLTILFVIKVMFSYDTKVHYSKMILVYSNTHNKFIDIPFNPCSVNARVLFENLSDKHKKKITINNSLSLINKDTKEFLEYCNCLVVQLIFSRFLTNRIYKNKADITNLKDLLLKFRYIDVDSMLGGEKGFSIGDKTFVSAILTLPEGFKITKVEKDCIKLDSKYGFVNFIWSTHLFGQCTKETELLTSFEDMDLSNCIQIEIRLKMEYGFKLLKIFKKSTIEFENFIDNCRRNMDKFDEENYLKRFRIEILPNMLKYMNNNHKKPISTEEKSTS